jgi:hypothetical protein
MNYIWNILQQAEREGIDKGSVVFKVADIYSPYMEIASEDINISNLMDNTDIEVNPWYRFYEIFKDLFNINLQESLELREVLLDILIHFLGDIDLNRGICKNYIYKQYLLREILSGIYGEKLKENIKVFSKNEINCYLEGLINLYSCNLSLHLFKKIMGNIFKNNIVYINKSKPKDIYIYIAQEKSDDLDMKMSILIDTFLPINMNPMVFWNDHFAILGLDNTMKIDAISLVQ